MELDALKKKYHEFLKDNRIEGLNLVLAQPSIFEILKISSAEIRHSNFLAWLLNPKGSHGLGNVVIKRFFTDVFFDEKANGINELHIIHSINHSDIQIHREWNNIDLLIESDDYVVCIENKVLSKDGVGQLARYKARVQKEFPSKQAVFVFLTRSGDTPTNYKDDDHICYSYEKLYELIKSISEVLGKNLPPKTTIYIEDYLTTLNRHIMKEPENDAAIKYAEEIYKEHKDLIEFVINNGKKDLFFKASKLFLDKHADIEVIKRGKSVLSFLPKSWSNIKALADDGQGRLYNAYGGNVPLYVFFEKSPLPRPCINLVIEIGPFANLAERNEFRQKIATSELKDIEPANRSWANLIKKPKGDKEEGSFTRFYVTKSPEGINWDDEESIAGAMEELYQAPGFQKHVEIISTIKF